MGRLLNIAAVSLLAGCVAVHPNACDHAHCIIGQTVGLFADSEK